MIDSPQPWFTFVNPKLFDSGVDDVIAKSTQDFELKTALGLELVVLLAQPQPSWTLLVKVMVRSFVGYWLLLGYVEKIAWILTPSMHRFRHVASSRLR